MTQQAHSGDSTVLLTGLGFPEGLRWHESELWFSDMRTRRVMSMTPDGTARQRAYVPAQPSGLGWRADGTLLVASMLDQCVIAATGGHRERVADLSGLAIGAINDMLVDEHGRAYVGSHGFDPPYAWPGADFAARVAPAPLILLTPDGQVSPAAEDGLRCANGMALTADRSQMIVAESAANRILAFDVGAEGRLTNRRVFAEPGAMPDGLCIDAEDALWVGLLHDERFVRIGQGGEVLAEIATPGRIAVDCVLGGDDGRTLFTSVTYTDVNVWSDGEVQSGIEAWRVDVGALGAAPRGSDTGD
jgi:sugar lactone lactonase YvrE